MTHNPFFYGNPVSHEHFIGRRKGLRRVIGRLQNGQSTAIIGDPRIGKTSFLNYLSHPETRSELYGQAAANWLFSMLDIQQMLSEKVTPAHFWQYALRPLQEQIQNKTQPGVAFAADYELCAENEFGNFTLERLFSKMKQGGARFILLLDEFDALLHHPVLNSAEFYGGLRALASSPHNAFSLIIASQKPLSRLNSFTLEFYPSGSPFFNIFSEFTLGPLSESAVKTLLASAGEQFTPRDKQILRRLAGHHPYLLQAAASVLWECYEDKSEWHNYELRQEIAQKLFQELQHFFDANWKFWSPEMRKAFSAVAMSHQADLLPQRTFDIDDLVKEVRNWGPELKELQDRGALEEAPNAPSGYRVAAEIMLAWLADELVKAARGGDEQSFDGWLHEKEIAGAFLSNKEKSVFRKGVSGAAKALGQGANAIIEAFGKGLGSGMAGKIV